MDCQKGTFDTHCHENLSEGILTSVGKATNSGFFKKNSDLVRSGTKVAFSTAKECVAARTAHCVTARSVEYVFEGASCGKANGVRG
jgi:hypothetical protein